MQQVREHNGQHCAGDYTCGTCDPGRVGYQTVEVEPTFQTRYDWCFVPDDQDASR
jgi:hypothetical protein